MKNFLLFKHFLLATLMLSVLSTARSQSISYRASYDLTAGATLGTTYGVSTTFTSAAPRGVLFSDDGLTMFLFSAATHGIHQYSLSEPYDLTSTVAEEGSAAYNAIDLTFSEDGTLMFVMTSNAVYRYTLENPFDITGTITAAGSYSIGSGSNAIRFSPDGSKMFIGKSAGNIRQYSLSTLYDFSTTVTDQGYSEDLTSSISGIAFSSSGTKVLISTSSNTINQFTLSTPFDVTATVMSDEVSFVLTGVFGLTFSPDGTRLFAVTTSKNVLQYDVKPPQFREAISNTGAIAGSVTSFTLNGDTFTHQGGTLTFNTDFQVPNIPTGLTPVLTVGSDGTNATLSFSGSATNHQNSNDVSSLTFNFLNSAFTGGNSSAVSGAQSASTGISLDFRVNQTPILGYGQPIISNDNIQPTTFSVGSQETTPTAMAFTNTGTKLFVIGTANATIYEYNLTTPFEITEGVSSSGNSYNVSTEETQPKGIQFNGDGTKMFIVGAFGDDVNQYSLSSPYDITSTVTPQGSFSISSQTSAPEGFCFSPNGENMYVTDISKTYMYRLSNPYDITSGVTYDVSLNEGGKDLVFSFSGKELYLNNGSAVTVYELEVPYFIGYGVNEREYISYNSAETQAVDFFISPDRSHLLILGDAGDDITQVNLPIETFSESFADDGSVSGTISITLVDDLFANAGGTLLQGIHYTLSGLPSGLTSTLNVASDGGSAAFSLSGKATSNDRADNVYDIQFTFNDNAFVNSTASQVTNAVGASSYFAIAFKDINGVISTPGGYDLSQQSYSGTTLDISSDEASATGLAISNDGSKLFISGADGLDITTYNLTTPFDVSAVTLAGAYDISSETSTPLDIAFNSDGTKMYVSSSNTIFQYALINPFDLSTGVSLDGSKTLSVSKLAFSSDGSRLITQVGFQFFQYELRTPFDITDDISLTGSTFHTLVGAGGISFSPDGNTLFMISGQFDRVYKLNLTSAFDIVGGVSNNIFLYVGSQELNPIDFVFSPDGSRSFLVGASDEVNQYEITLSDFTESTANDGSVNGSFSFGLAGDVFTHANGSLTQDTDYTTTGMPEGLISAISISSDGLTGTLSFSGNADDHQNADDVSGFTINFLNSAFVSGDASSILNGNFVVNAGIDFIDDGSLAYDGIFYESYKNDGSVDESIEITITNDTFTHAGGSLASGTDFLVANLPAGLTPQISVAANGLTATLTLSGAVAAHQDADDVADLTITFENSAFSTIAAENVINGVDYSLGGIDFKDNNPRIAYGNQFDFDESIPVQSSGTFSVASETTNGTGLEFNADGTKMYVTAYTTGLVYQYSLSTPFDISAGVTADGNPLDVSADDTQLVDLVFSSDGTKLFTLSFGDDIHQYNLATPYIITSGVTLVDSYDVGAQGGQSSGIAFSQDGSKMFVISSAADKVSQYSLETPFDISAGVSFDGQPYSVTNYNYQDIFFSRDGTKMFLSNSSAPGAAAVRQYQLADPFDITSGVTAEGSLDLQNIDNGPAGVVIGKDGTRMFVLGSQNDMVYQFDLVTDGFVEADLNDGALEGDLLVSIQDEQFASAGGQLTHGSDYTITNLPTGLTPTLTVSSDGYSSTLTLAGNAEAHQTTDDITDLTFTFGNSAFEGGNASAVANAMNASSNRGIDFRDNLPAVFYGDIFDVSKAVSAGTPLDISGNEDYPTGIAFNSDGTKMFVAGEDNSLVHQYALSTPYEITSGVSYTASYDLSAEDEYPQDLAFSADGMRMFILGDDNYYVYQYNLTTPFDITAGVSYSGHSVYIENEDSSPHGLTFSADGTKMYMGGSNNYEIYQYSIGASFDLSSTVAYEGSLSLPDGEGNGPTGLVFSPDGRQLLISDGNQYGIFLYSLGIPFDVTQGATSQEYFDLDADGIYDPSGIATNPTGSRIFVTDGDNGRIAQYNIDLGGFTETSANDGTVEGSININIVDDTFASPGGTLASGSAFTITNLPNGLVPSLAVAADGYTATLSFTGKASNHKDAADISGLLFTFTNSAFANSNASDVNNAIGANSNIGIDFLINTQNDILTFALTQQTGPATIDNVDHTVTMEVNAGTSLTSLVPTITLSDGATSNPVSGMSQNFTSAVNYTVAAEDGTEQVWEVTITEQQVAPTDILLSETTIDENNSVGDVIGTLSSVDGNTSQTHLYTLVSGTGSADNGSFSIVGTELRAGVAFDYETKHEYKIRVKTDDQNGGLFQKALVITINDVNEIPTDIALDNAAVDESNPAGTVVGTFSTTDEDAGQSHLYSLVSGTGDGGNSSFAIDGNQLKTAATLDFETQDTYSVRVETDDQNGGTLEEVFVISVNDLPAQVTALTLDNQSVMENLNAGAVVGNLTTLGEDLSGSYTYTLVSGTGDANNSLFGISGSQLVTSSVFDFEAANSYSVRIKTNDGNGNTLEKAFTISVGDEAESSDANILTFVLAAQAGDAVISNAEHTVAINVVYGTDITALTPEITISAEASMDPASGVAQDFTNPVVYTVTAEEGNTQDWTVTVSIAPNTANDILTFVLAEQTGDATISATDHTVAIGVPYGTDLTALTPTITVSEQATIDPTSETAVDFSSAVVYTVTAGDGSTQEWTVTVTPAMNSATDILTFVLAEQIGDAVIDAGSHTVSVIVATGTDATALTPTITVSEQATISPASGATQDFSAPVSYTVTAGNGATEEWTVTITVEPAPLSSARDILTFSLPEETGPAVIDATAHTVAIEVVAGTNVSSLTPTITISAAASISPASGAPQDFTSAVVYTVTAEDGSTQEWTVTVTVAPATEPLSSAKDIISFLLHEQTGDALINTTDHTVTIEVETGTDITNLSPAITVSDKATVSPGSEVTQDFSAAVVYTVTAEDGSTQEWTVTVTVEEGTKTGIPEVFANLSVYPNPTVDKV
ncbi:MAG: DUF5018 domain-containing protein, partial [Imperialibacter sp.]|uniref:DUF5018 domain-containing protein n=1 Tax=Imperialibacter sp. TaxID=2038411 RepID=UPI0032EC8A49